MAPSGEKLRNAWHSRFKADFFEALGRASTEEEVKAAFIREFNFPVDMSGRIDLRIGPLLFEFKKDVDFRDIKVSAKVLAQALYYTHKLWENNQDEEIKELLIVDKNEVRVFSRDEFTAYYRSNLYDWTREPSNPDSKLVDDLVRSELIQANKLLCLDQRNDFRLFETLIYQRLNRLLPDESTPKTQTKDTSHHYWYWAAGVIALAGALSTGFALQQRQTTPSVVPANLNQP